MSTVAEEFAERLINFRHGDVDAPAIQAAKHAIIDTVAVTLLGSIADCARIARDTTFFVEGGFSASEPCLVYGTDIRTSPINAAFLNGIASHADDYDDFTDVFGGHPSVPVLPAAFSLAEFLGASGHNVMCAYIAGVEIENRIANGVHFHHYEKGWHPTSTLGVFGAAAAAAHLLNLDFDKTVMALTISASYSSGIKANFGSMTKPLHIGHALRSGLQAAMLAKNGFTAKPDVFEHHQGYFEVYNGAGHYDIERMLGSWFAPAIAVEPGASIKQFPCCGSTHPAVYMALRLTEEHNLDRTAINNVTAIEVRATPKRLPHTNNPNPRTGLQAKFSMQYAVARALISGPLKLTHFENDAYAESAVRALMEKITVIPDESLGESLSDNAFGAEVTILRNGQSPIKSRTEHLPGRGREFPMTEPELRAKFDDCAHRAIDADSANALYVLLDQLQDVSDFRDVTASMQTNRSAFKNTGSE